MSGWPPITDGPYWSPATAGGGKNPPETTVVQTPPLQFDEDTGVFSASLVVPPWVERGNTAQFWFRATHFLDGPISSWTTGPTLSVLLGSGDTLPASYFTLGTVVNYPAGSNSYYVYVTANTIVPPTVFVVRWVGTYTPKAGAPALSLQFQRPFTVKATVAPSKFFLLRTNRIR